ncbi:type II toxin-antitoxin system RelE/ParE family toxin [Cyanobium sp. ATX 6F1]|nr:type II toxin-antitoxin system RelE/ParE family toxin [Cyanobium sp. ATX 6F1]
MEVRSDIDKGIARVIFTVEDDAMILLHGFVKKSAKMPTAELKTAKARLATLLGSK